MKVAVSVIRREYGSVVLDVDDSIRDKSPRARKDPALFLKKVFKY